MGLTANAPMSLTAAALPRKFTGVVAWVETGVGEIGAAMLPRCPRSGLRPYAIMSRSI